MDSITSSKSTVLFVDDEINVLEGIKRNLYRKFRILTALSGEEGLALCNKDKSISVVVSDMRMPEMDGITFLAKVKMLFPECIRVMLTGNADLETAISAVNEGNIFRFITKPCPTQTLEKILDSSLNQYHLIQAEKELLEKTLKGSIKVLIEILSLSNPAAFTRANRIRLFALQIARILELKDIWKIEISALLSQLGWVTIPSEISEKFFSNQELLENEQEMVQKYPEIGSNLIANIPRLEIIAKIIVNQNNSFKRYNKPVSELLSDIESTCSEILKISKDIELLFSQGQSKTEILNSLEKKRNQYNPLLIEVSKNLELPKLENKTLLKKITDLRSGMILAEDIRSNKNVLISRKGQEVTPAMCILLKNYLNQGFLSGSVLVSVPL